MIEYFLENSCREQAVVPVSWYQLKPCPTDQYHLTNHSREDSNARMVTNKVEELRNLRQRGFLVAIPLGDDDDAYALALSRREDDQVLEQRRSATTWHDDEMEDETSSGHLPLGGYIVSNDMFHNVIRRDDDKHRSHQLPLSTRANSLKSWLRKKRISYSFANIGTTSEMDNQLRLGFIQNPRSDLIETIDECNSGMR